MANAQLPLFKLKVRNSVFETEMLVGPTAVRLIFGIVLVVLVGVLTLAGGLSVKAALIVLRALASG